MKVLRGLRPNLRGSRPNLRGSRPNLRGSRPNLRGSRPNLRGSRPNLRGSRPGPRPKPHFMIERFKLPRIIGGTARNTIRRCEVTDFVCVQCYGIQGWVGVISKP